MSRTETFLIVEKGEPYDSGTSIALPAEQAVLGRACQTYRPDVAFFSRHISRRHAVISRRNNMFCITDLSSKHGTQVNGLEITADEPCLLRHGDTISLARDTAVLVFNNPAEGSEDDTVDFTGLFPGQQVPVPGGLVIRPERREVLADGAMLSLSGKDLELLLVLYRNRGSAVSYDDIKAGVWSERITDHGGIPDVGNDEISALVYRLRRRLGTHGDKIVAVPRFGYMLDV